MANTGPLKCCGCKKRFPRETLIPINGSNYHSKQCAIEWAIANQAKGRKKIDKFERKEIIKAKKEFKSKDRPWQHKQTQKAFNKLRKLQEIKWFEDRGLEPECISCGKKNMDWCCSHLKTVGSQGALRYDPINTKLGCNRYCNMALSGNINGNKTTRGYLQGLRDRFGDKEAQEIINYCNQNRIRKWTVLELVEMRKKMNKEIRKLQNEMV